MSEKVNKKFYQKWWFWVIVVFVLLGAIVNCGDDASDTATIADDTVQTDTNTMQISESEFQPIDSASQDDVIQMQSDNYLVSLPIHTADVWNGSKTEIIGEYAYIEADKEIIQSMSEEEFYTFAKNIVDGSGYNWFTIDFGDSTGIQFAGSIMSFATYGEIDAERCITSSIGYIFVSEEAVTYEKE